VADLCQWTSRLHQKWEGKDVFVSSDIQGHCDNRYVCIAHLHLNIPKLCLFLPLCILFHPYVRHEIYLHKVWVLIQYNNCKWCLFQTVNSVVSATKFLLEQGVPEVYTNYFCQDPLELHFGRHRALGRRTDNPTLYAFG
jgi:hypothetical protein